MKKTICVYCSSSEAVDPVYFQAARSLGEELSRRGCRLIYGAGAIGLMGACARTVRDGGSPVTGVIPEALNRPGIVFEECDDLMVTGTMGERKALMFGNADGFVALPGGYGTLEELLEIITLKQLHYHEKPIVMLNTGGFFDPLIAMFERIIEERFAKPGCRGLYRVTDCPREALDYIETYQPGPREEKWFSGAGGSPEETDGSGNGEQEKENHDIYR